MAMSLVLPLETDSHPTVELAPANPQCAYFRSTSTTWALSARLMPL